MLFRFLRIQAILSLCAVIGALALIGVEHVKCGWTSNNSAIEYLALLTFLSAVLSFFAVYSHRHRNRFDITEAMMDNIASDSPVASRIICLIHIGICICLWNGIAYSVALDFFTIERLLGHCIAGATGDILFDGIYCFTGQVIFTAYPFAMVMMILLLVIFLVGYKRFLETLSDKWRLAVKLTSDRETALRYLDKLTILELYRKNLDKADMYSRQMLELATVRLKRS